MYSSHNYYKVLSVSEDASELSIKQAFRRLAREYHPDLNPNNAEAEAAFKLIREAYDVLGDRFKRRQYDRYRNFEEPQDIAQTSQLADHDKIYSAGIQLASQRKYDLAHQRFSQAIALKPTMIEAYMGRCQVRYALGDDRGVLEDTTEILRLKSQVPQAYYYQGRSHQRQNFVDHAIQAYSHAIHLDGSYAAAYYYRGLARLHQQERQQAIADLKTASSLYRASGDQRGLKQTQLQLRQLKDTPTGNSALAQTFLAPFLMALINPAGNVQALFRAFSAQHAALFGFGLWAIAILSLICSATFFWPTRFPFSIVHLVALGFIPFAIIAALSGLFSLFAGNRGGNWSGDIFLAGLTVLPVGLASLLSGPFQLLGNRWVWSVFFTSACLTTTVLFLGMIQINRLSQFQASFAVPFILLICIWMTEFAYLFFL